ncbi:MAG: hypothetical protein EXS10_02185 [Phycisphaerales bacterium]|nr:hypothetical protein [Phycisphaerales bacterium]
MPESALVVFDDQRGSFGPLTDLRAAFELRVGLGTSLERIEQQLKRSAAALFCAPEIAALLATRHSAQINALPDGDAFDFVNGSALTTATVHRCNRKQALEFIASGFHDQTTSQPDANIARFPWEITARIAGSLAADVELFKDAARCVTIERRALRSEEGQSRGAHAMLIDRSASIGPFCVIDASNGPVVIGANVVIGPLTVLIGPCAILAESVVSAHAQLKANTIVGPHCRVGGEVGGCIFQAFSNKSHDGHLGDCFVGEWVNIGAGSCNSNLLNTYGEVIVRLDAEQGLVRTGRQFWGGVVGDHVKLAIGTRLMTGTTIGTGAMIASSQPPATLVERFAWITDNAQVPRSFRFDKFMETANAMMSRRAHAITPALEARLSALHAKAASR